jgi:spermidine/putrescine ABC transporter ATP-binding subunit
MSNVTLRGIAKRYGDVAALNPLDLQIHEGEFLTLLGPSGCGKTTTLRLLAGFIRPSEGSILFGEEEVTSLPPQHREIGMVFQDYALFPHMTIADNIGFGLVERRRPAKEIKARVEELLGLVKLANVGHRYPSELSGGQQQRIAVARAVAHAPRVLLMDEPLGALDLKLRETMQFEIRRIQQELKITTVYVTHDQTEAMNMSDRIAVMNGGNLEQIGSADDIYNRPKTRFVADFVGQINFLSATDSQVQNGWRMISVAGQTIRAEASLIPTGDSFVIGVRPEQLSLRGASESTPDDHNALAGRIVSRQFSGSIIKLLVDVGTAAPLIVDQHPNEAFAEAGDQVTVVWDPRHAVMLNS